MKKGQIIQDHAELARKLQRMINSLKADSEALPTLKAQYEEHRRKASLFKHTTFIFKR